MEVITSHSNLDFDGFASMIAAKKLFPDAQLVLPNVISKEVRNFLVLYRGSLNLKEFYEIELSKIKKLIIVDTCSYNRVVDFKETIDNKNVSLYIYDHHEEDNILRCDWSQIEKVGACTSIIVEEIIKKGIELKPFEATILALGIYSDTNCLTFSSTTVRDVKAVTYLFEQGAYLDVVSAFVGQPLSDIQREAFDKLMQNIEDYKIKGLEIGIAAAEFEEYIDEIAYLTHRILSLKDYDAVFTIVSMKNRIYIVGRSTVSKVNIDHIMKEFSGGGHSKAGSAIVKDSDIIKVKEQLIKDLNKNIEPSAVARDIGSHPVKTVSPDITLKEVDKIMLRFGHTGLPVVKDGKLIGIITRRDIDKAIHHGYGHSPVKAYMSRKVVTITPETPIREIQHKMIEYNIGRLPVIENDKLIGIVTRTDILKQVFGEDSPKRYIPQNDENGIKLRKNFSEEINNLDTDIKTILQKVGEIGDKLGHNVYVVGGFVRDLMLGVENLDIDIVAVGDGIKVAEEFSKAFDGKIKIHKKFGTARVEILNKFKIDIVTARREFYEFPAALPTVEKGSIKADLLRRDFTINSMALVLNKKSFGTLVDYFGGQRDLQEGLIRVLYNMSFIEDPTRIFRAIRFEQRYKFKIEAQTFQFMIDAISSDVLKNVSNDRLTEELFQVLKEKNVDKAILRLVNIGLFNKLYLQLAINGDVINLLRRVKKKSKALKLDMVQIYMLILFTFTEIENMHKVIGKFKLTKTYINNINLYVKGKEKIIEVLENNGISNYEIYNTLQKIPEEVLFIIKNNSNKTVGKHIEKYLTELKDIKLSINGKDLERLGIKPGPQYKKILESVFQAKVNKKISNKKEEIDYVHKLIN